MPGPSTPTSCCGRGPPWRTGSGWRGRPRDRRRDGLFRPADSLPIGRIECVFMESGAGRKLAAGAGWLGLAGWLGVGCAAAPPDIPVVPLTGWEYVGERTPVPGPDISAADRNALAAAWEMIVGGRLGEAYLALEPLRLSASEDSGVLAADGFFQFRRGDLESADGLFAKALEVNPGDALAALGAVLAVPEDADTETLYARLTRLSENEPESPLAAERIPELRLDVAELRLSRARLLTRSAGPGPEVSAAWRALLEVMPDSSDIYLEAAEAAAAAGDVSTARDWFDRAVPLLGEGGAATIGARLAAAEMLADAGRSFESLERLDAIIGDPALNDFEGHRKRADDLALRLEIARRDSQLGQIPETERVTREQLAAVLIAELGEPESAATGAGTAEPERFIAIDLEGSWAAGLIRRAVRAGYLSLFPDHTFKPRDFVSRADLAESLVAAFSVLDPLRFEQAMLDAAGREVPDLPPGHRSRESAAICLELELLALEDDRFEPRSFASGAEAVRAVQALRNHLTS